MMDNEVYNMPIDMACQNPIATDGMFTHTPSVSHTHSNSFDLNNHNHIMSGYPLHSMLHGEPMNDLHANLPSASHAGVSDYDSRVICNNHLGRTLRDPSLGSSCPLGAEIHNQFFAGTARCAASLVPLLAARSGPHENSNDFVSPSEYPVEVLKPFVPNDCSNTLNSSFGTSINCEYDGIVGDMSNKWDFSKYLAPMAQSETTPGRTGFHPFQLIGNMDLNCWISPENASQGLNSPSNSSRFSSELSLSLATSPPLVCGRTTADQCSDISCPVLANRPVRERWLALEQTSCNSKNLSLSFHSYKPLQLSQLLSGSRYLHAMQEILAEIASYSLENLDQIIYPSVENMTVSLGHTAGRSYFVMDSDHVHDEDSRFDIQMDPRTRGRLIEVKKKQLLSLLQVVDEQYNQCLDEIHTVISAFHAVTELDPRVHACFALQTISFLYKNLRERISNRILATGGTGEEEKSFETSFMEKQWALQQERSKDRQLWRPQRGLPERSVSVLRAWMFQNFLHPYPKDAEKHLLAVKSGLTRSQVSNWFINARVRLWKPMIEEMYAEMNRRKGHQSEDAANSNLRSHTSINNQRFRMV